MANGAGICLKFVFESVDGCFEYFFARYVIANKDAKVGGLVGEFHIFPIIVNDAAFLICWGFCVENC